MPNKNITATQSAKRPRKKPERVARETIAPFGYNPTYAQMPFTAFGSVNSATPLDELNLNWRETDLPERVRTKHVHRLHPYLGKFIPQLVEIFLRKYFVSGQTVLDPFCGSGTTLVQANELGINSIGYDISLFNVLLCRAKTTKYDLERVEQEALDILEKLCRATSSEGKQLRLFMETKAALRVSIPDNQYLQKWFAPQALRELLIYRRLIESEGYQYRDLLMVILSRSARSARLTTHFDLDWPKKPQTAPYWCFKHSRTCEPITEAYKFLRRYTIDTLRRIKEFDTLRTDATVSVYHADSRNTKIPRIDGVITSPPYVGLIDYHEQHAYAYQLLGLEDNRQSEIGAAVNGSSGKAKRQYIEDLAAVFQHAKEAMSVGGRMIVIASDRANLYGELAERVGVHVEGVVERHVNRRTGIRSSDFFESVFIWRKV